MSFGFSIGDVITVGNLLDEVISRTRRASSEFADFTQDLQVTRSLFRILRNSSETYANRTARLSQHERQTIATTFEGIRDGLLQLQERLNQHSSVGGPSRLVSNLRFSRAFEALRQRLDMHMNSLHLIVQNIQLAQVSEIGNVVARIERAQQEDRQIGTLDQNAQNDEYSSNSSQMRYELEENRGPRSVTSSTSTRDEFIVAWRQHVHDANLSAIDEQSTLVGSTVESQGRLAPRPSSITPANQHIPVRDSRWREERLKESLRVACWLAVLQVVLGVSVSLICVIDWSIMGNTNAECSGGNGTTLNVAGILFQESGAVLAILSALRVVIHVWPWILDTCFPTSTIFTKFYHAFQTLPCFPNSTSKRSYVETLFVLLEIPGGGSGIAAMVITGKEYKSWLSVSCVTTEAVAAELAVFSTLILNTLILWFCYQRWQPSHFRTTRSCCYDSCRPGYGLCCGEHCLCPCFLCGRICCGTE